MSILSMDDVGSALRSARDRVDAAAARSGRDSSSVTVVVVTKTVDCDRIRAAVAAGASDLGENRVQEAAGKQASLTDIDVRWHLIGHLQTNKAARAAAAFASVQSLDSERVVRALAGGRAVIQPPLPVLVEVDVTGRPTRTGASTDSAERIALAVLDQPALDLRGLMTVAPDFSPDAARAAFVRVRKLRDALQRRLGLSLPELSMGMSDDFEPAVEEGATIVRLGRVIFGARPMPAR